MSINTVSANTNVEQLVQRLVSQADLNKDGQLSSTEFGSFLTHLIEGVSAKVPNVAGSNYATASAPLAKVGPTDPPAGVSDARTLIVGADACNGFNRITYCGFSPQDHQGANLSDPMNAKYALQQYLIDTNANLNGGAQAIVDALNQKYGAAYGNANFFTATDAETIMMPDGQYVHYAPNGYAMAGGTFNPTNTGEVFWGATGAPYTRS
jgi:hypothetical protein